MAQGSDIEIAREAKMNPIVAVAEKVGIPAEAILNYGPYKGKLSWDFINSVQGNPDGKLILVTAINPTPAGRRQDHDDCGPLGRPQPHRQEDRCRIARAQPRPCFGVKGGAAGGGYAQVVPMEDINLHFTAISTRSLRRTTCSPRCSTITSTGQFARASIRAASPGARARHERPRAALDRQFAGRVSNGYPREDGFDITVASEVMAILCLASDLKDLERRLGKCPCGYTRDKKAVTGAQLKASGAMTVLLKDALQPNIVQTLENNPVLIHGGPFANIAHGCNSVLATTTALKIADYVVTEAGFGADLGAESSSTSSAARRASSPPQP